MPGKDKMGEKEEKRKEEKDKTGEKTEKRKEEKGKKEKKKEKRPPPYECKECPFEYQQRQSLQRHMATEHGPKLYAWRLVCGLKTVRKDNLRCHYRQEHPERFDEVDGIALETEKERAARDQGERAATSSQDETVPEQKRPTAEAPRRWVEVRLTKEVGEGVVAGEATVRLPGRG
ncbi:nucleolar protein 58-like [Patiria miniata]|uniref:C2H2-type domain-containing protein n=1 Tax=Patiria miniata TaxID=46514 RepID=A0A914ASC6_PATMI|nr:nucleolar protein 58-like [Patiria miniata]